MMTYGCRIRSKKTKNADKYFVKGRMPEGWCALKYHQSNLTLALSFPVDRVPYLGILPDEGGWDDLYSVFIEPATSSFDRLDVAKLHNEISTVRAKSTYDWHLTMSMAEGTGLRSVNGEGQVIF